MATDTEPASHNNLLRIRTALASPPPQKQDFMLLGRVYGNPFGARIVSTLLIAPLSRLLVAQTGDHVRGLNRPGMETDHSRHSRRRR
jgi:hypothetical protein